jgi:hypothetical protein
MKKILVLITLLINTGIYTQTNIGINTKANISESSGNFSGGGGGIGLITETKINEKLLFNLELNILPFFYSDITDNFGVFDKFNNPITRITFDSPIINLPIKINYKLNKTFFLESGFEFNYKLSTKHSYTGNGTGEKIKRELVNDVNTFDYGFSIGFLINLNEKFAIKTSRTFGISKILQDNRNSYYSISLNYFFSRFPL